MDRTARACATVVVACLLGSCGGGGGDSSGGGGGGGGGGNGPTVTGNGAAPTSGPGDTQAYYPLANTNAWDYNYTTNDPNALTSFGIVGTQVTETTTIKGLSAAVLYRYNPTSTNSTYDTYLNVGPGGVTNLGNTDTTDTITPQIIPYVQQLFPVTLATVSTVKGTNLPDGTDSAGHAITLNFTQTIANVAYETVEVPSGTYKNALKQTTTVATTASDNGQSATVNGVETTWYVAGLGPVKDTTSVTGGAQTINTDAEMRFAGVNGAAYGFGTERQLANSMLAPAQPLVVSDGTNFLIVTQQYSGVGTVSPMANFVGTIIGTGEAVLATFNITIPAPTPTSNIPLNAVAGFDGANYLVVYEVDNTATSQPRSLYAVKISPTGALVAGPNLVATAGSAVGGIGGPHPEALAFDGAHYLLVFPGASASLQGILIDPATTQATGGAFNVGGATGHPSAALAFDGTHYLLVWFDDGADGAVGLYAQRISTAGAVVDPTPLALLSESTQLGGSYADPAVSFDGSNYLVTYLDFRGANPALPTVSAARVSPGLALLDGTSTTAGIVVSHTAVASALASVFMEGEHWIFWASNDASAPLSGSRVTPAGAVAAGWSDGFMFAASGTGAGYPAVAASGSGGYVTYLAAPGPLPSTVGGVRLYPSGP